MKDSVGPELALHFPTISELYYWKSDPERVLAPGPGIKTSVLSGGTRVCDSRSILAITRQLLNQVLGPVLKDGCKAGRIYFGNEFCQNLMPSLEQVKLGKGVVDSAGLAFTLVTPYVTDSGLKRLMTIFDYLESAGGKTEVVVNDFGVLSRICERYGNLKPVAGRLLNKNERDPRFAKQFPFHIREGQIKSLQQCGFTLPHFSKFLVSMGVERVELDVMPQGMKTSFLEGPFAASMYYPWTFLTTGRVCEIGSLNRADTAKFLLDSGCGCECRRYYVQWVNTPGIGEAQDEPANTRTKSDLVFQKGNSVFMLCEAPRQALAEFFDMGFDRVVFEPVFPI
jgi:hypothetical protein